MLAPDQTPVAERRRLRLRVVAKLMLGVAFGAVLFVFVLAFLSTGKPGDPTPGMRVDLADLAPGATRVLLWEGRPVLVQRRTRASVDALRTPDAAHDAQLRDPESARSEQPASARNAWRSTHDGWFVAIALGTDYGCPVHPVEAGADGAMFVDECRGSRYDAAGRVFAGEYADRNLVVPAHTIEQDTLILGR